MLAVVFCVSVDPCFQKAYAHDLRGCRSSRVISCTSAAGSLGSGVISAQSTLVSRHQSKPGVYHVGLPKVSHSVLCFLFVFGDVGLNGDVGKGGGNFAEIGEESLTAGQGETGGDDGVDEGSLSSDRG
jgi:hypothetical protein